MILRCYPTISDWVNHQFGTSFQWPIHSFGFFVALAFVVAALLASVELKRMQKLGLLQPVLRRIKLGEQATPQQLILNAVVGFVIGFKLLAVVFDYSSCASNPQEFLFSTHGNILGGLIGAALGAYLRYRQKQKKKLDKPRWEEVKVFPHQMLGDLVVVAAIAGLVGAKIFSFLEDPDDFRNFLKDPASGFFSGLTIYGGLIFGTVAVVWFARKRGIPAWHLADALAPALMLAYGIGRIGCEVSGDGDWGIASVGDKPGWLAWLPERLWAYDYTHNIINEGELIEGCKEDHCYRLVPAVFPTPLYETIASTLLFAVLWGIRKRLSVPGMLVSIYVIMNGVERFFIEKIRVNARYDLGFVQPTQAEIISLLFVVVGVVMLVWLRRRARKATKGKLNGGVG